MPETGPRASDAIVTSVPVLLTLPLRQAVLRPGRPPEESRYPGDEDPRTAHVGVRLGARGEVVAVGTLLPEPPPWPVADAPAGGCWRIRGMATRQGLRNRGYGRLVLDELLRRATAGSAVWCNARAAAVRFYEAAGFEPVGDLFDAPHIGPHQAMWRPPSAG